MSVEAPAAGLFLEGPIATLSFNRPEVRNALNLETWRFIADAVGGLAARRETRLLIVRGSGGHFAAGADISEFDAVFATAEAARAYLDVMSAATEALETAPFAVLAAIDGLCIGAAVAVALACDLRFASPQARFAITPAKLGMVYSHADTARVVRVVGASAARDLLFTGRMIDAEHALHIGLIDRVASDVGLDVLVAEWAAVLVGQSPSSIATAKRMIRAIVDGDETAGRSGADWFVEATQGADFQEGLSAFRERRPPSFVDR